MKSINLQIQEAQQTLRIRNMKITPKHIKLLKTSDKKKTLKVAKENNTHYIQSNKEKNDRDFS